MDTDENEDSKRGLYSDTLVGRNGRRGGGGGGRDRGRGYR